MSNFNWAMVTRGERRDCIAGRETEINKVIHLNHMVHFLSLVKPMKVWSTTTDGIKKLKDTVFCNICTCYWSESPQN